MPRYGRTFRVFVSSTFADLKAERNALQEKVFPELRELCREYGCRFQPIDLRWGVSDQASLDQRTMEICLSEIARCQEVSPKLNFLVLLGDRYGWCPLPYEIPVKEFEEIKKRITGDPRTELIDTWYRRDDNTVQPVYVLQPRKEGVPYEDFETWEKDVERPLRSILVQAVAGMGLDEDAELKYVASAAHQEIHAGALKVKDAHKHVICCFREIQTQNFNDLVKDAARDQRANHYVDLDEEGNFNQDAFQRLAKLKEHLCRKLPQNIVRYPAVWKAGYVSADLNQLCGSVRSKLWEMILSEIDQTEDADELQEEAKAHLNFGKNRRQFFTGRKIILQRIKKYLESEDLHTLAIWGESGTGKSALMAEAANRAKDDIPKADVIARFIGATPDSSGGRALLQNLCKQVSETYGVDKSSVPLEYRELVTEFPKRLALATSEKPLVLFIDALDQLSDTENAKTLRWLPEVLPENVRIIVSTLPGECKVALEAKRPAPDLIELGPMPLAEGKVLLGRWLEDVFRKLQDDQLAEVTKKFKTCGLPLYLKLAFEEAKRWRSYDGLPDLGADIPDILNNLFDRLKQPANHGELLVSKSMGYLRCARNGLTEDEMLEVLGQDDEYFQHFIENAHHDLSCSAKEEHRLPVVIWSRLYHDLESYLTERATDGTFLLNFYHRQFRDAVDRLFLGAAENKRKHIALSVYFGSETLWISRGEIRTPNIRKSSEFPFQLTHGRLWDQLKDVLTDFDFLHCKAEACGPEALIEDFGEALRTGCPHGFLRFIEDALRLSTHVIQKDASQIASQAVGRLLGFSEPDIVDFLHRGSLWEAIEWLRPVMPTLTGPGALRQTLPLRAIAIAVTNDERALTVSDQGELRLWDLESGVELASFVGSNERVTSFAATQDGRWVLTGSSTGELRVWDLVRRKSLGLTNGQMLSGLAISSVAIGKDGWRAVSASKEGILRVWDLDELRETDTLIAHDTSLGDVELTEDGNKMAFVLNRNTLKVFDLLEGRELHTLEGHSAEINNIAMTTSGSRLASGSADRTVKVWDLEQGVEIYSLSGHGGSVYSVAITADGEQILSGSQDKTVRVWDIRKRAKENVLIGHKAAINAFAVIPGGKIFSGSDDGHLKLWELKSGKELWDIIVHHARIEALDSTPDGRLAVSCASDGSVVWWDLQAGQIIGQLSFQGMAIKSVVLRSDKTTAILGTSEGRLEVWDLARQTRINSLFGHDEEVLALALSKDEKKLVSGSSDKTVRVWDLKKNGQSYELTGHGGEVLAVAVTGDGHYAVSGSMDKTVRVWNLQQRVENRVLTGHSRPVKAVAITPDSKKAITGSWDRSVRTWDLATGQPLQLLSGHKGWVQCIAVMSNGLAVSGSTDLTLRIWDLREPYILTGHGNSVQSVSVSPDGRWAVSCEGGGGDTEGNTKIWDLTRLHFRQALAAHHRTVPAVAIDKEWAISGSEDGTVKVWDVENGLELCVFTDHVMSEGALSRHGYGKRVDAVALSTQGKRAISGAWDGSLKVWDLEKWAGLCDLKGHKDGVYLVAMATDGRWAVSVSWDGTLRVWDIDRGQELANLPASDFAAIALLLDGNQIVSCSADRSLATWDLRACRLVRKWRIPGARSKVAALAPDAGIGMLVKDQHILEVWDLKGCDRLHELKGHEDQISSMALTPDGIRAVSTSRDRTLRVWDLCSGKQIASYSGESIMHSCAIQRSGNTVISGDMSGRVHILRLLGLTRSN